MKTGIGQPYSGRGKARSRNRRLLAAMSFLVVLGFMGIMGLAFPETAFVGESDPRPTITVQIYNYSEASPGMLAAAEHEAGRILGEAGLRVIWLECPIVPVPVQPQASCGKAFSATDLRLRVLATPVRNTFQDSFFGFTIHPVVASVYYEYAMRRAKTDDADFETPTILGCVIAHELGHLLLGSNGHSGNGIMQPRWERNQFRQLMMGTLFFTTEQSGIMREAARTRSDVQSVNFKKQGVIVSDQLTGSESTPAK